jgi:segregation and condensation protein B
MELKSIVESILFAAQKPLTAAELVELCATAAAESEASEARAFRKTRESQINAALEQLQREHAEASRSYRLVSVAGAWQFVTQPEYAPWLKALFGKRNRPPRLSQPALETLAIIAYRQPLTRAEIEQVRGVSVDGVLQTLLERGLVEQIGRAEVIGRPMTYGTTSLFLEYFGLARLEDLPAADELRRLEVKKPEGLLTVDAGLATAPPGELTSEADSADEASAKQLSDGTSGGESEVINRLEVHSAHAAKGNPNPARE